MAKDYGQYCGLARALDVVGDRWNLLIVRQLLIAPARYQELREGLPGVATNLLADRLRGLESAGVVQRVLAGGGSTVTYALTPWGAELRGPIEGLVRWSSPLMVRGAGGDHFRVEWLLIALPALFSQREPTAATLTVGLSVADGMVQVRTTPDGFEVGLPDGTELDAVVSADAAIVLGLAAGLLRLDDVIGTIDITGDTAAAGALFGV